MSWLQPLFIGAVIGLFGWWLRPDRARLAMVKFIVTGAVLCCVVQLAGDAIGVFGDGDTLEWLAGVLAAIAGVALLGSSRLARREGS
jgi:uncharacterized membrane protein YeaQ/YmgE (transglycosylase-associated protein family)